MRARNLSDVDRIRASVQRTRTVSDKIVGVGPFSLGLDGVLAWIPGAGWAYSVAAGGFLLLQGARARIAPTVLARMAGLIVADACIDMIPVPLAPAVADMLFTGHKWAADVLLKEMDRTVYYPGTRHEAAADATFQAALSKMKGRRVVHLGEASTPVVAA